MGRFKERVADTDVYSRINLLPMTEIERQVALNAMQDAETIVDAFIWISNSIKGLFAGAALKPRLRS